MPTIYRCEQGTDEWHQLRSGRITASNFKVIMEGGPKAWTTFMDQLRGVGNSYTGYAKAMDWGTKHEPQAVAFYELEYGVDVERIGFAVHSELDFIGSSPDGLIDVNGGIEVKCPFVQANHAATIELGMPDKHIAQVQGNLWVMEREWWDFISFDPRLPADTRMFVQRIYRDEAYIKRLEEKCLRFWEAFQMGRTPGALPKSFAEVTGRGE